MKIPAICNSCGTYFPSGFDLAGRSISFFGNLSGPCPNCGGMGRIPDGVFNILDDTIEILQAPQSTISDLEQFRRLLNALQGSDKRPDEVAEEIRRNSPQFGRLADLLPQNRSDLYAFISMLLAALAVLLALRQGSAAQTGVSAQQVIQNFYSFPQTPEPESVAPKQPMKRLGVPVRPERNAPCPCGSGKKYKKCHGRPA